MKALGSVAALALAAAVGGLALIVEAGTALDDPALGLVETGVAATLIGLLLLWRRPGQRVGPILVSAGALFGLSALASGVLVAADGPSFASEVAFGWVWLAQAPLVLVWALLILALPEGNLGTLRRGFLAVAGVLASGVAVAQYLFAPAGQAPEFPPAEPPAYLAGPLARLGGWEPLFTVAPAFFALVPLLAFAGMIARFRAADPVGRQQLKWVLAAAAVTVVANLVRVPLDAGGGGLATAGAALGLAVEPLPALGIALAVLRYRLWELDLLLSRALVYAVLWAVLAVLFLIVALAAGLLVGGPSVLVPVGLALLVALVGQPLRSRLERLVRRLVYGDQPSGYAALTRFGETLADADRAGQLAPRIADSVRRALNASWAGVWLRVESDTAVALRPVAVAGADGGPPLVLSAEAAAALRGLKGPVLADAARRTLGSLGALAPGGLSFAALAPLSAGDELVGMLFCGQRAGRPLGEPDLQLLAVLAREAALVLRNARLEAELRGRLEEIEAQSEELRHSRRRLVGAQDAERRRIERDLHDGVQQQLVTLAAKLARASRLTPANAHRLLQEAARDAEESVFALQELGRGIYPSLLADRGLAAALRTQANRVPADVRVEVEPAVAGQRFDPELEAALYFVALEAIANAQKHAPCATLIISLRKPESGGWLVLEVHDDGGGFDPRRVTRGAGLQNMEDRIAATGGTFAVDSRRGAGVWIRAAVPLDAQVLRLQRPAGDSRR